MGMNFLFISALFLAFVCSELVVHEWGTYTSVQGSNGKPLPGCHHGEESLPEFVRSRADTFTHEMWEKLHQQQNAGRTIKKREVDGIVPPPETLDELKKGINCGFCKVMDWIPTFNTTREVTQKLETPVIYFYSPKSINDVMVTVQFPQGIVTEYYPSPAKNLPLIGKVPAVAGGAATWKVNIAERDAWPAIPVVSEDSIWAPSRRVNANSVMNTVADENERHIFYRGLGRFEGPLSVKSNESHITIQNTGEAAIEAAWLLSRSGDNAFLHRLPSLAARTSYTEAIGAVSYMEKYSSIENFLTAASVALEVQLVKTGLYGLEARAMVDTWARSYFLNEGTRVLYIAPQAYPNTLLPWTITPRPTSEVRVLVGRVELITRQEEVALGQVVRTVLTHYEASPKKERVIAALLKDTTGFPLEILNAYDRIWSLGRFAESKIRRVLESENIHFEQELVEEWILSALTY